MAFPVTINGRTYTLADFEGTNYVDGFPDALEDFVTQAGDIYNSTSSSSVAIGTGSKTFTIADSGKPYQAGTPLRIADAAAPETNFMDCIVTSYSGTTLVVDSFGYAGSGTKTSWTVNIGGAKTVDGTLAIAQGGTGATTAAAARTALGVGTGDSPTFAGIDVTGTVTADGLTSSADIVASANNPVLRLMESDSTDLNSRFIVGTGVLYMQTTNDADNARTTRFTLDNATGDISFYEDTGTTPKFFWDASAESLGIGTTSPSAKLHVAGETRIYPTSGTAILRFGENTTEKGKLSVDNTSNMIFETANAERMRIDSSGNVGIGTTSPSSKLHIEGSTPILRIRASTDTEASLIHFADQSSNFAGVIAYDHSSNHMGFYTQQNERMRIDSSGNLLVGTTSGAASNNNGFTAEAYAGGTVINVGHNGSAANGDGYVFFRRDGTALGSITQVSSVGVSYNTTSDQRLKENITDAPAGNIDAIKVRSFDWKADGSHQDYGMVAQELEAVAPYAVTKGETEDDMWSVDYSKLVPMLIKEIQDLKAEVAALKGA